MKNLFKSEKGFTLIELLVVIAIIGILSSIVLASLNTARSKGSDAAIKADVAGIRSAAEVVYDNIGSSYGVQAYSVACGAIPVVNPATNVFNDASTQAQLDDAILKNAGVEAKCVSSATGYAVAVPLRSNSANAWCVDSTGNSKQIVFANFTNLTTVCP